MWEELDSSASPLSGWEKSTRSVTIDEIHDYIQIYTQAAADVSGFDGAEVDAAARDRPVRWDRGE